MGEEGQDQATQDAALEADLRAAAHDDSILRYFSFSHLPPHLADISRRFARLSCEIIVLTPRCAERTVALRKLLEAKDAAVRAALP